MVRLIPRFMWAVMRSWCFACVLQGLLQAWNFNQPEALRAFRLASEADPTAPMPFFGMAYALGPGANRCGALTSGRGMKRAYTKENVHHAIDSLASYLPGMLYALRMCVSYKVPKPLLKCKNSPDGDGLAEMASADIQGCDQRAQVVPLIFARGLPGRLPGVPGGAAEGAAASHAAAPLPGGQGTGHPVPLCPVWSAGLCCHTCKTIGVSAGSLW